MKTVCLGQVPDALGDGDASGLAPQISGRYGATHALGVTGELVIFGLTPLRLLPHSAKPERWKGS